MRRVVLLALVFAVFLVSETRAQSSPKALRESLLKADRALSAATLEKGLSAAVAEVASGDAIFLYGGVPVVTGKANIASLLNAQPALAQTKAQWLPLVVTVSSDGSLGATWGALSVKPSGAAPDSAVRFGKYISVWRRTPSGAWQLAGYVEMGLSDEKSVIPTGLDRSTLPESNPMTGSGAAFARADMDFAKMAGAEGAPKAFGRFAAPDAMTLPGTGEIVVGPPAIQARMSESPAAKAKWAWHPVYSEGSASGDLGFTVGEAVISIPGEKGPTDFKSKYLTVWRRQRDGSVRYIVDGGNGR